MLFFVLLFLHVTAQAMETVPSEIFYNDIALRLLPSTVVDQQSLAKWSEVYKEKRIQYTEQEWFNSEKVEEELQNLRRPHFDSYIKKIDDLASKLWCPNVMLVRDLISLSLVNKQCCRRVHEVLLTNEIQEYLRAGRSRIEKFQKTQLCLSLNELGFSSDVCHTSHTRACFKLDKNLCNKNCQVKEENIMLEYCFRLNKEQNDVQILIALSFGHGQCKNLFVENHNEGGNFNCRQFGNYLFNIGESLAEKEYKKKLFKLVAYYIKQQPSLPVKCLVTYANPSNHGQGRHIEKSNLYYSAINKMGQGEVIIGRNDTHTGIHFVMIPFAVTLKTNSVLKLIQILPMYYIWDMESNQTHRISNFYKENFPASEQTSEQEENSGGCVIC
ncbi:MAG TPA: hypothetical protein VL201_04890 [Patescibacteria group bacterium]|jgi:hypothetical protein|nr:hypothetical protein [Patescibacteria group bacterium]